MKKEIRTIEMEFRVSKDGDTPKISGYSAKFNSMSEDLGGFREKIAPGAFKRAIEDPNNDTVALFNHDSNYVLGRRSAGTLKIWEDETGLFMENTPPDNQWSRDLQVSMARGDIKQQSFGFTVRSDSWETIEGEEVRTINEIGELFDVGPVTFPAYTNTDAAVRSLEEHKSSATTGVDSVTAENEDIEMKLLLNRLGD